MKFLKQILINGLSTGLIAALVLGLIGFLLAGTEGIANGLAFGGVIGFVMGMTITGMAGNAYWWTGISSRYGEWQNRRESGE